MIIFRRASKRVLLLLSLLLSLLLLFSQGTLLHVHYPQHSHDQYAEHSLSANAQSADNHSHAFHQHLSQFHLAYDKSHHDHGVMLEFDILPDALLKIFSGNLFVVILFLALFSLALSTPLRQAIRQRPENKSILSGYYLLSPPLRAPPQYF